MIRDVELNGCSPSLDSAKDPMTSGKARVLVVGGSGMVGSALRFELPRAGLSIESPGRDVFNITGSRVSDLPLHDFDYVVNAAGLTNVRSEAGFHDFLLANSVFPYRLADRCEAKGVRLIHLSCEGVFDGKQGLYTEESSPNASDIYGRSKALGEPARAMILRASVFGPEEKDFRNTLCRTLDRQGTIAGFRNHRSNPITSVQLARIIAALIVKDTYAHGIRHLPGEDLTHLEMMDMIVRAFNRPIPVVPKDDAETQDFRLRTMYPDELRQLGIPSTAVQLQEIRSVSDDNGRWLQVFVNEGDMERADQLHRAGRLTEAEIAYRGILGSSPDYMPALVNLGVVLSAAGKIREAISYYQQALQSDPHNAIIHNNLGNAYRALEQSEEAVASLERAVALNPRYEKAFANLGDALFNVHRFDESRAVLEKALALNPNNGMSWNRLGRVHTRQCRVKEAIKCYRKAVELQPEMAGAHSNVLFTMHFLPDFTHDEIAAEHRAWNDMHARPFAKEMQPFEPRDPGKKPLRIGFVSDCFKRHPVGDFLNSLFRARNRDELEFFCYSDVLVTQPMTEWFRDHSDQWHDIGRMSDADVAGLIRQDEIDILIDLAGHTGQSRLLVFARKPAPVQATWMGYINTTGMDAMDYIIADQYCVREGEDHLYTEKAVRLPDDFLCYRAPDFAPDINPLPAMTNGYITFGSFNQLVKVTVDVVLAWAEVLKRVPDSRMLIVGRGFDDWSLRERFIERFATAGIAEDRLELLGGTTHPGLMARYHLIDIALDTFPYVGGTTTCEALWMGVPVITFAGERFCSRHSSSHLINAGLSELVASDVKGYIDLACELGADKQRLQTYRATLRGQCATSPLCDAERFAENFTKALYGMWKEQLGLGDGAGRG